MKNKKCSVGLSILLVFAFGISNPIMAQTLADEIRDDLRDVSLDIQITDSAMDVYVQSHNAAKKKFEAEVNRKAEERLIEAKRKREEANKKRKEEEQRRKNRNQGEKIILTLPKNGAKEEAKILDKKGRTKTVNFPKPSKEVEKKLTVAQIRKVFYPGIPANKLTKKQRQELLKNYAWLLKNKVTLATLIAITRAEGTLKGGPKTVVGYTPNAGYRNKTSECQRLIKNLDLSKHAIEQNLPQRCFIRTKAGNSSAFGYFQFVYFRTFRELRNQFGFNNFSRQTQAMAVLELIRRSNSGAFIALVQNNPQNLQKVVKGTSDWAGSSESKLPGAKHPILKYAKEEMNKLKGKAYYQKWLNEFTNNRSS